MLRVANTIRMSNRHKGFKPLNQYFEQTWEKLSSPFVKFANNNLKTVPLIRDKLFVPVGRYAKKLEYKIDIYMETDSYKKAQAEELYNRIVISEQEANNLGALVSANFVAFWFWWNLFWEIRGHRFLGIFSNRSWRDNDHRFYRRRVDKNQV